MKVKVGAGKITAAEVASAAEGRLVGDNAEITSLCTDSRETEPGCLFAAIRGEKVDGHDYIKKAFEPGGVTALCERVPDGESGSFIVVEDTVAALCKIAAHYRRKDLKVVGVTGSVGKTTTKEFISAALGDDTYRTHGNFNSVIGLPLTIMEIPQSAKKAVLEMGMSARGEIESMSKAARPDIAVITNIGSSHLEMLGSRENILAAKLEIVSGMNDKGILLINGDDEMLVGAKTNKKTLKVGFGESCDFRAEIISEKGGETLFSLNGDRVKIPTYGKHNVMAASFGLAAAKLLGVDKNEAIAGLAAFEKPKMRQNIYEENGVTIIEDCYNASPESMRAALDVAKNLAAEKNARIVALLGEMLELGSDTARLHFEVGKYAAGVGVKKLITLGELAENIANGAALPDTVVIKERDHERAAEALLETLREGDILLVKASRGVAAEKALEIYKERRKNI